MKKAGAMENKLERNSEQTEEGSRIETEDQNRARCDMSETDNKQRMYNESSNKALAGVH